MAEAKLNGEYAVRVISVGVLMLGMCAWSLYDGMVAWPRCNLCLEQVRPSLLATNMSAEAWLSRGESDASPLERAFQKCGCRPPAKLVKKLGEMKIPDSATDRTALRAAQAPLIVKILQQPIYSAHDLQTQFVQAGITLLLGLCAFGLVGLKVRKRYRADATGLSGISKSHIAYVDIQAIDWTKWDDKGIVKLKLKSGARHTLDGWHFKGITGIVDEIQTHRPDLSPKNS